MKNLTLTSFAFIALTAPAFAGGHAAPMVVGSDQDVSGGTVSAESIVSSANGWMVVHRTDAMGKPGPVIGYAPVRKGETADVTAILTEAVAPGDMLMLMLHGEDGGMATGAFEYTLGAKEDGPVKIDGNLVMATITAK